MTLSKIDSPNLIKQLYNHIREKPYKWGAVAMAITMISAIVLSYHFGSQVWQPDASLHDNFYQLITSPGFDISFSLECISGVLFALFVIRAMPPKDSQNEGRDYTYQVTTSNLDVTDGSHMADTLRYSGFKS